MDVSHTLSRRFFWADNILWKEDIQGHHATVILAARDLIVDTAAVSAYLTGTDAFCLLVRINLQIVFAIKRQWQKHLCVMREQAFLLHARRESSLASLYSRLDWFSARECRQGDGFHDGQLLRADVIARAMKSPVRAAQFEKGGDEE
ncbi:hypothetical protein SODALDRAFT_355092 [Sodiomyces alkalinus F11]|uniref:Uncharacterized protein n=1 Tax=Sodiomyces alkalinus (strain CBS 110278 / VKM F-3762 / F11) TaxID=1314773 RepID=A0A3N2Q7Z5_SODAK|nr:hypothetical protein SODALDRAFT_355092 [Sodiomyces alkalinus F11]ROT42901.1 hypothetical protein SODALDRAFT_355092 [Sodiomyces alkalinus F11]